MVLVKKLKFLHLLCLSKKNEKKDYKNKCVRKTKNYNFSKGVSPSFWSKI